MDDAVKPRKTLGLTCGTLTAWLGVFLFYLLNSIRVESMEDAANTIEFFFAVLITWYLAFGLPIAIIVCFTFGGLAWYVFEALRLTKMRHAVLAGGIVGAIIGIWTIFMSQGVHEFTTVILYMTPPILIGIIAAAVTHRVGYKKARQKPKTPA